MISRLFARRTPRALFVGALVAMLFGANIAFAFDFDDVAALARRKARAAYQPPDRRQPAELELLGYDRYRDIRFRPDRAIWRADGAPFDLMFFHRAQSNPRVRMNEVVDGEARHIPYDSADFDFGKNTLSPEKWGELDYAGLRVHYHLNGPEYKDELIVFLGASYFRALAAGTRYGLSARGLAVDTVGGAGEEFPYFPEFWIVKPAPDARSLVEELGLELPIRLEEDPYPLAARLALGTVPTLFLVSPEGRLEAVSEGFRRSDFEGFAARLAVAPPLFLATDTAPPLRPG